MSIQEVKLYKGDIKMILVSLLGMDIYQAEALTKKLHKPLVEAFSCSDEELNFYAPSSLIIHDGVEQTAYRLEVIVRAPYEYQDREKEVVDVLLKFLDEIAVHQHIVFNYFDEDHEYIHVQEEYPIYMTETNTVKAETHEHDEDEMTEEEVYDEPYYGDIISEFDQYVKEHPDATDKEVYEVLSGIRKKVTEEHHKSKKES